MKPIKLSQRIATASVASLGRAGRPRASALISGACALLLLLASCHVAPEAGPVQGESAVVAAAATATATAPSASPSAQEALAPATCGSIQQLHAIGGVLLAGQPSEADLKVAREDGIKTIVSLRKPAEVPWDEGAAARGLGLEFHQVPFQSPEELTDKAFEELRALLRDTSKRPLLLHCGSANRVGAVWLAHRVLDDGVTFEAALAEARTVGLRSEALLARARAYIEGAGK